MAIVCEERDVGKPQVLECFEPSMTARREESGRQAGRVYRREREGDRGAYLADYTTWLLYIVMLRQGERDMTG